MPLAPGFHLRIPKADYMADPCARPSLSASIAHTLVTRSPAHAWAAHPKGGGAVKETTAAMAKGTLIDSLLLGGDTEIVVADVDDWRTKAAREFRDGALAAGKLPVKRADYEEAQLAAEKISANLAAQGVTLDGQDQVTVVWEQAGVICRGRIDHWHEERGIIYDLKKTENAAAGALAHSMVGYGMDIQHAAYVQAVETLRPELAGRVRMLFLAVEITPPYAVVVAHPAGSMRQRGEYYWKRAVDAWAECLRSGTWPAYPAGETEIEAPPWALAEMEAGVLAGGSQAVPF